MVLSSGYKLIKSTTKIDIIDEIIQAQRVNGKYRNVRKIAEKRMEVGVFEGESQYDDKCFKNDLFYVLKNDNFDYNIDILWIPPPKKKNCMFAVLNQAAVPVKFKVFDNY